MYTFVDSDYLLPFNGKIKAEQQTPYSITEVARILGVSASAKSPIRELLTKFQSTIENQNAKNNFFFNNFVRTSIILFYTMLPLSHLLKQIESRWQYTKKVHLKNIEVKKWIKSKQRILTKMSM